MIDSTATGNRARSAAASSRLAVSPAGGLPQPLDVSSSVVAGNAATGGADFAASTLATGTLSLGNVFAGDVSGVTYTADWPAPTSSAATRPTSCRRAWRADLAAAWPNCNPLIDAGLANGLTTDQRGEQRIRDRAYRTRTAPATTCRCRRIRRSARHRGHRPYLAIASPPEQGNKKIEVEVVAARRPHQRRSGQDLRQRGQRRRQGEQIAVQTNGRAMRWPKKKKAAKRILGRSPASFRKVTAKLTGKLAGEASSRYQQDLGG